MKRIKMSVFSSMLAVASCAMDEGEDDATPHVEAEAALAADGDLGALAAIGCSAGAGLPFAPAGTGLVFAESWAGGCAETTSVEVVMRIDRSWWPDKTIASTRGSVIAHQVKDFPLNAACSAAHGSRVFAEVRLFNSRGSAKYQSGRAYILCP